MRFSLIVRAVDDRDLGSDTPTTPDPDEYEMYLKALQEELSSVDGILRVTADGSALEIETARPMMVKELREAIKPALSGGIAQNLRFVDLVEKGSNGVGRSAA